MQDFFDLALTMYGRAEMDINNRMKAAHKEGEVLDRETLERARDELCLERYGLLQWRKHVLNAQEYEFSIGRDPDWAPHLAVNNDKCLYYLSKQVTNIASLDGYIILRVAPVSTYRVPSWLPLNEVRQDKF
ncbi:hypothetical protein MMC25_005279 [Agyrium rufum]|nr:hypothetical protein [Agyrium rufum]